jgi:hypothetical protein
VVSAIVYAVTFTADAEAPSTEATGLAPVRTLTARATPTALAPPVPVTVTVRAAGDAPASIAHTSDEPAPAPLARFSSVHVEPRESVTGAVNVPEPVLLPQFPTATISELAAGVKLAVVTVVVVEVTAAGAEASSTMAPRRRHRRLQRLA